MVIKTTKETEREKNLKKKNCTCHQRPVGQHQASNIGITRAEQEQKIY